VSLFADAILVVLTPAESDVLLRPVTAERFGGHQRLLQAILERFDPISLGVRLDDDELQRVRRYAEDYGSGGYQVRFRALLSAAWRAGWVQP
jgi:hypothetical protein